MDEIRREVDDLEPFIRGYDNKPTTAFSIIVKLFTMRLTKRQLQGMINTKALPYLLFLLIEFFQVQYLNLLCH